MASTILSVLLSHLILLSIFSSFTAAATTPKARNYVQTLNLNTLRLGAKQKLTKFHFYWHDITSGKNATAVRVVLPQNSTDPTGFGTITMINDPMTEGLELSSKMVGRSQGFYALSSQDVEMISFLMSETFAFTEGKYNGSTITILGRNPVHMEVREMPVVGGSGLFRFATGYVEARTHSWDQAINGSATVEYTCYVLHY